MKTYKIIYWTSTAIIFLFDSVMPALTSHLPLAVESIKHLGYPDYFRVQLTIFKVLGGLLLILPKVPARLKEWAYVGFKVLGGLLLILPKVPARLKEWAYVGFAINFISASVAHASVDGFGFFMIMPLIIFGILMLSYVSFHKLNTHKHLTLA